VNTARVKRLLSEWAKEFGFDQLSVGQLDLDKDVRELHLWLEKGFQGTMKYMGNNLDKRANPKRLFPGTLSVISVRMPYRMEPLAKDRSILADDTKAFISRYALGRDYHKTVRARLKKLGKRLESEIGSFGYRVFSDSAPILERGLARNAGLGWIGKNTMLIHPKAGSYFFLGEIFTDLNIPHCNVRIENKCGPCTKCINICPTKAIVGPYQIDARKCISYLTIESKEEIPLELRPLIGNRIFGCDDCQIICPWNKFAKTSRIGDFDSRHNLDNISLIKLFLMDSKEFEKISLGSPIKRISHEQWLRNIAVALGNAKANKDIIQTLGTRSNHNSDLVRKHVSWALSEQKRKLSRGENKKL